MRAKTRIRTAGYWAAYYPASETDIRLEARYHGHKFTVAAQVAAQNVGQILKMPVSAQSTHSALTGFSYLNSLGLPARTAADIVDIYASIRSGALGADYEQHKPALGQVKLEDFTKEFAAAF